MGIEGLGGPSQCRNVFFLNGGGVELGVENYLHRRLAVVCRRLNCLMKNDNLSSLSLLLRCRLSAD